MDRKSSSRTAILRGPSTGSAGDPSYPHDLMEQAARRLRTLALVYAFVFFMASFFSTMLLGDLERLDTVNGTANTVSIVTALLVAWLTTLRRVPALTMLHVGLGFEILGSYGIAVAQYWGMYRGLEYELEHLQGFGLSWVAVWILLFNIVVPVKPRRALVATAVSASAVPVVFALSVRYGGTPIVLSLPQFFTGLVLPYVLVILMAHVGTRAIYGLGAEVAKARELGSYHLEQRLGQGGMGEVWRARHRMLARPAAIKLIRPDMLSGGREQDHRIALERFAREAQATASMRSPHTIELFDFGAAADGSFYYVMELLDGFDVEALVRRFGPIPAERAIHLLRQACDSLAEAHERGLIHRDVKPANIFVCRYGRRLDFVKVLDFGLVKDRGESARTALETAEGTVGGTPAYMSPEQAAGDRELDGRSDIYSLGCVAYWLVTGRLVFDATPVRTMAMHLSKQPSPPSAHTELDIPEAFERVILQCLEKDPARRPQGADELDALLSGCRTGTEWSEARARQWWDAVAPAGTG